MRYSISKSLLVAGIAVLLSACGAENLLGGGESGTGYGDPVAVGKITGFGSVYVNGVHFNTDRSQFKLDGAFDIESKLQIGMIVTVRGAVNSDGINGVANLIEFEDNVEGAVQSATPQTDGSIHFVVMGQTVIANMQTLVDGVVAKASLIPVNSLVEVSGHTGGDGTIYATLMHVKKNQVASGDKFELKGLISQWSADAKTFKLSGLTVNTSEVKTLKNLSTIRDGLYVKVEGVLNTGGEFLADEIEYKHEGGVTPIAGSSGGEIKLEGYVTSVIQDGVEIEVNGQKLRIDANTEGMKSGLTVGSEIRVEARFGVDGALVAKEIEYAESQDQSPLEIEAKLGGVDTANQTITVFGQTFKADLYTTFKDETGVESKFNLSKAQAGDRVEVRAYRDSQGQLVLTALVRVRVENAEELDEIRGVYSSSPQAGVYVIDGFTVKDPSGLLTEVPTVGAIVEMHIDASTGELIYRPE